MSTHRLVSAQPDDRSLEVRHGDRRLLRYVFRPEVPANESPKPYVHPITTLRGNVLTNFRPNDHPWHHALALTLTSVDDTNFWGGPTWHPLSGYTWQNNHGRQEHHEWQAVETTSEGIRWVEVVHWISHQGERLLSESRMLQFALVAAGDEVLAWHLRWSSQLTNATGRGLRLSHYHAEGLAGSHYTGLCFRGARDLLANTADEHNRIEGPDGLAATELQGCATKWLAVHGSHDGDPAARSTLVFIEHARGGHGAWFLRPALPVIAFCPHFPGAAELGSGSTLALDHSIVLADGAPNPAQLIALL